MKAKKRTKNSKFGSSIRTVSIISSILVLFALALMLNWLVLKWFWAGVKIWHCILLFLSLTVLVALVHWYSCIMRGRSHRTFIDKVSEVSEDFAGSHNLMLKKDPYSGSAQFHFRHPQGGRSHITLQKWYREKPMLLAYWVLDDYDASSRRQRENRKELTCLEEKYLYGVLGEALKEVLSWQKEDLASDEAAWNWKETCTKEEFERFNDKYPVPKLD